MDKVIHLLQDKNQDCNFTSNIRSSSYDETNNLTNSCLTQYSNYLLCIIDNYDLVLSNTPQSDKELIFKKRVIEISTDIEEKRDIYYENYNYNSRKFSIQKIQQSLLRSSENEVLVSTLCYLNDYYQTHFVIADVRNRVFYETCKKNYPKKYLECNGKKYSLSDSIKDTYVETKTIPNFFTEDNNLEIYKNYLKPIGTYKIDELKDIAKEFNIPLLENGKNKKKQILYDNINSYHLLK